MTDSKLEEKITLQEYISKNNIDNSNLIFIGYNSREAMISTFDKTEYPITKKETMLCYAMEFQAEKSSGYPLANLNTELVKIRGVLYTIKLTEQTWKILFDKADKIEKMASFI